MKLNPALNFASFGRLTLHDQAAQHLLALRWALQVSVSPATTKRLSIIYNAFGVCVKLANSCLIAALVFLSATAHAADAMTVFGLPLGGRLKAQPHLCPTNTDRAKDICWIDKPFVASNGDRLGSVHLPNSDGWPAWAAYAMFSAQIAKDGVLEELKVRTLSAKEKHIIAQSLSSRFGLPNETTLPRNDTASATWARSEIFIYMLCDRTEFCIVEFRSPKTQAEREREAAARRQKDSARPTSP